MTPIFISGIGTGVGKTIVSAILTEALQADYWKPVQAGNDSTDAETVRQLISNNKSKIHLETYKLALPASPHIAARQEERSIKLDKLERSFRHLSSINDYLIIEGAGGLMAPLNDDEFVGDLIKKLETKVILVSQNYLGSINHSLLSAQYCKLNKLDVLGWIFNGEYMNYEQEIEKWSGIKKIFSLPTAEKVTKEFVSEQARLLLPRLKEIL